MENVEVAVPPRAEIESNTLSCPPTAIELINTPPPSVKAASVVVEVVNPRYGGIETKLPELPAKSGAVGAGILDAPKFLWSYCQPQTSPPAEPPNQNKPNRTLPRFYFKFC